MKRILFLLLLTVLSNDLVLACRCGSWANLEEAFTHTSLVVHGKVRSKTYISFAETIQPEKLTAFRESLAGNQQKLQMLNSKFVIRIDLEVINLLKGNLSARNLTIYTTRTGSSCGYLYFEEGQEFVVFGHAKSQTYLHFPNSLTDIERPNTYWTNQCTATHPANGTDLQYLQQLSARRANPQKEELKRLQAQIKAFNEAFQKGDVEQLTKMITDNYQHSNGTSRAIGKTAWLTYLKKRKKQLESGELAVHAYKMSETQIELFDDMAIVTAKISVSSTFAGERRENEYRVTNVWVKEAGIWKRAGFHDGKIK